MQKTRKHRVFTWTFLPLVPASTSPVSLDVSSPSSSRRSTSLRKSMRTFCALPQTSSQGHSKQFTHRQVLLNRRRILHPRRRDPCQSHKRIISTIMAASPKAGLCDAPCPQEHPMGLPRDPAESPAGSIRPDIRCCWCRWKAWEIKHSRTRLFGTHSRGHRMQRLRVPVPGGYTPGL